MAWVENKEIMAENINYYLKEKGKTRKEACQEMKISYSTLTEWANGRKYPRIDKIEIMAKYFNILKADLIEKRVNLLTANEIGSHIKNAREAKGISPEELSESIGVSVIALKRIEKGTITLTTEVVQKLHDELGIPVGILLGYNGTPEIPAKEVITISEDEYTPEQFQQIKQFIQFIKAQGK